jgi:hypothetical protein
MSGEFYHMSGCLSYPDERAEIDLVKVSSSETYRLAFVIEELGLRADHGAMDPEPLACADEDQVGIFIAQEEGL